MIFENFFIKNEEGNMINLIKLDLKNCLSSIKFKLVFLLLFLISLLAYFCTCFGVFKANTLELYPTIMMSLILNAKTITIYHFTLIIIPLIACLIYSDSYIYERDRNISIYFHTRSSKCKYFISKILCIFAIVFITLFFTLCINEILTIIAVPNIGVNEYMSIPVYQLSDDNCLFFMQHIFDNYPYLYNFMLIAMVSLYGAIIAVIGFNISVIFMLKRLTLYIYIFLGAHLITIILPDQFNLVLYIQAVPYSTSNFIITLITWITFCILTSILAIWKENYRKI